MARLAKLLLILPLIVSACCEKRSGEPGDDQALEWRPPHKQSFDSGPLLDCHGASIGPITVTETGTTVQNCNVRGSIRIRGEARNGNDTALYEWSRLGGYVEALRRTAPSFVRIDSVTITADGEVPLYIAPGVTFVEVRNVTIGGTSDGPMVYLDAESSRVTIEDSRIDGSEAQRETIAIDASDHNVIVRNTITLSQTGGIFLYRNCGEAGVVRHTTPSNNVITDNVFVGDGIGVLQNARNGDRCYCSDDAGYDFGSSGSDLDHARFNVIENNAP